MYWLPREKVLVPTDFFEASVDAVHTALSMVESGHSVHVLHVVEPVPDDLASVELADALDSDISETARRKRCQERLVGFLAEHQLEGLTIAVGTGDPALAITQYAVDTDIDLIVMAAHGYARGERITIGSVTERVLHNADCPVLVLRPDGRVSGKRSRSGVRESKGYSPAESRSRDAAVVPRSR